MKKCSFLEYCLNTYGTSPDYPFDEDFETAVLRHANNRKWYAIVNVSFEVTKDKRKRKKQPNKVKGWFLRAILLLCL